MNKKILIEVCCGSVEDGIAAQKIGADRIELNSSLFLGGLTPSIGAVIECKRQLHIPVMVMIRPRNGGFCYSTYEIMAMREDIKQALSYGADGIVFGILKEDGSIDEEQCKSMVELIGDKEAIFHRAFDVTPDPFKALDTLVNIGVKRILTKGQQNTLEEGAELIKELVNYSNGRIEILPGGCRPYNVDRVVNELGINQVHLAAFVSNSDFSTSSRPHVYFGSELRPPESSYTTINSNYLMNMKMKIDSFK